MQGHEALTLYFQSRERREKRRAQCPVLIEPRRMFIHTCNHVLDRTKTGAAPFKDNLCCRKLKCCAKYSPQDVLVLRQALLPYPKNSTDRRAFLSARYMQRQDDKARGSGSFKTDSPTVCRLQTFSSGGDTLPLLPLETIQVCANFFHWAYYVSRAQTSGDLAGRVHRHKRSKTKNSYRQWDIEQWLVDLSQYYQLQPDSDIVLLPFANRASVYEIFIADEGKDGNVHSSYFHKVWRTSDRTKHIRLRKHLRFTKCDTCVDLRERKSRTMDRKLLDQIRQEEYEHYEFVKAERGGYYLRRKISVQKPDDFLSLIIDGADWYSYACPFFATRTHESSKIFRVPVYLMGVISHGRGTKCYVVPGHFKQGTNVVLDILIRTLFDMKSKGKNIPRVMYLQLDNTCKQNKNQFLLGILGYLVFNDVHDKIIISFLPKGHTHEDIDQLFSRLVIALLCRDARSVQELMSIIRSAYRDKLGRHTETEELEAVANLSEWIAPYLENFTGLTKFRQFVIKKIDGTVCCRCRVDSVRGQWRGIKENTDVTKIFKRDPPRVIPTLGPCQRREVPDLKERKKYEKSVETVQLGMRNMSPQHILDYAQRVAKYLDSSDIMCDWPCMDLRVLGQRIEDAKRTVPGQVMEEESDEKYLYNIGDVVLVKADSSITPNQRFWVCQIMNISETNDTPHIDYPDPVSVAGAPRWFKVWWREAPKEFGKYKPKYHNASGVRTKSMSWEEEVHVICKLKNGLTTVGGIRNYRNYRREVEYEIKRAMGDLQGEEELEFEEIHDDMTSNQAEIILQERVFRRDDNGEQEEGIVTAFEDPSVEDSDRRIYFTVTWASEVEEKMHYAQLKKYLCDVE